MAPRSSPFPAAVVPARLRGSLALLCRIALRTTAAGQEQGEDDRRSSRLHRSTNSMRLFWRPLLLWPVIPILPTSRVLATWVPPSACVSRPCISTIRIRRTRSGTRLTWVRMRSGFASAFLALQLVDPYRTFFGESLVRQAFDLTDDVSGPLAGEREVHPGAVRAHLTARDLGVEVAPDHTREDVQRRVVPHVGEPPSPVQRALQIPHRIGMALSMT